MSQPGKSALRNRIFAVLASLVALWAFAAYVTIGEGISLVWLATLEQQVAKPTEALVAAIQEERRASVEFVTGAAKEGLDAARAATDAAAALQRQRLEGTAAQWSTSAASDARLADLLRGMDDLPKTRSAVDARQLGAAETARRYTALVQLGLDVYDTYTAWDDSEVIYQTSTLVLLTHSQEMISQEETLMAGAVRSGAFDKIAFTELVGAQRYLSRQVLERLPQPDRDEYRQLLDSPALANLKAAEDAGVIVTPTVFESAIAAIRELVIKLADLTVERVKPAAIWIVIRLILAAGLGLAAVVFSIRFAIRGWRTLQQQLAELRIAALDLAHVRLPNVVAQLKRGEDVNPPPPMRFGSDDVGQVGQAFNAVQQTVIEATIEQAELRRGVREVFLSLAHRIQALIHRQLKLIDSMERRSTTDVELAELYQIDHLATRVRRNAENLIVLSGMPAGRTWRGPVSIVDILRGAVAEVEDYPRVQLRAVSPVALSGHAVGDVIHLLAELMENATSFSPPKTEVIVSGMAMRRGYLVEIADNGLGMTLPELDAANLRLADPPEFQLTANARLGFFVVGKLALRYGIKVRLHATPSGGVTASVLIPAGLTRSGDSPSEVDEPELAMATTTPSSSAVGEQLTPAGLPVRTRRAVPEQRQREADLDSEFPNGRSPEEVSRLLAAYAAAAKKGTEIS